MHATLLVISSPTDNVNNLLEKFYENREVDPTIQHNFSEFLIEFMRNMDHKYKLIKENENIIERLEKLSLDMYSKFLIDHQNPDMVAEQTLYVHALNYKNKNPYASLENLVENLYHPFRKTCEFFAEDYYYGKMDDNGNLLTTRNPDGKYDWYEVGGRWAGYFKLKTGSEGLKGMQYNKEQKLDAATDYADAVYKRDIDWVGMEEDMKADLIKRYNEAHEEYKSKGVFPHYFLCGIKETDILEDLLSNIKDRTPTYAILKDGVWLERSTYNVKTKQIDDDNNWTTKWFDIVNNAPDDSLFTLIDYHS